MKKHLFAAAALFALIGAGCTTTTDADEVPSDEVIGDDMSDRIRVSEPDRSEGISSPLAITGEARGTWFFEASFPVKLLGEDGTVLAEGHAEATSDWMTEDFVPFTATLTFTASPQNATLILMKDNPSGLPANDAQISMPVVIE